MPYRSFLSILLVSFLLLASPLLAGDLEELEASFNKVLDRLRAKDLDGFLKMWHPQAVLIVRNYPFPVDSADAGTEVWREIFSDFFQRTEEATYVPIDVDFRVVGETGMVWGMAQSSVTLKDGTRRTATTRLSVLFVQYEGAWRILHWHGSERPGRLGSANE